MIAVGCGALFERPVPYVPGGTEQSIQGMRLPAREPEPDLVGTLDRCVIIRAVHIHSIANRTPTMSGIFD